MFYLPKFGLLVFSRHMHLGTNMHKQHLTFDPPPGSLIWPQKFKAIALEFTSDPTGPIQY